jgi:hypothetical protein
MSIQHSTIQSADAHEPKHITTSAETDSGKVITPNGASAGTSVLRQLDASEITVTFTGATLSVPTTQANWLTALFPNGVQAAVAQKEVTATWGATLTPALPVDLYSVVLGGATTIAAPTGTPADGQTLVFRLIQDGTGSRIVTWNAAFRFSGGTAPTLTTTAAKTDYVSFKWNAVASKWDNVNTALNF